ncbi:hypothetical protein CTI12_AA252410 [Artemisia annua]|uniref:Uncharacterized protein n=1 Tax=Artemisia annua TaxID=35608 RepID=A0A2U1NJ76_ARTAN|nr:hypothetical protein CTI12_AA252410 [Artemisia annua]
MVLLLVVITSMSSILSVSTTNNDGDQEIFTVVEDPTSMHHEGMGMSKAKPIEIGKFLLEDGKVLTLARKSSPSRNCVDVYQPCGMFHWCCDPYYCCDGAPIYGTCVPPCEDCPYCVRVW